MVLITIYWEYIFAPIQILGQVTAFLLCFGEVGQTGTALQTAGYHSHTAYTASEQKGFYAYTYNIVLYYNFIGFGAEKRGT